MKPGNRENPPTQREPVHQGSRVIHGRVEKRSEQRPEPARFRPAWLDGPVARSSSPAKPRIWHTIDLGYEIPFASIPSIINEGFRAKQDRVMKRGDPGLAEHYQIAQNCLLEYREFWFCDILFMIVLTVISSSVIPSVAPGSRIITAGPRKMDPKRFAANLITHMLWYVLPKEFPWEPWEKKWGPIPRVPEMTRELRKQGVNNWLLQALKWVDIKKGSKQARNGDVTLRSEKDLLQLRSDLLSSRKRRAHDFIALVFGSRDDKWVEACSSIIKEKTEGQPGAK
jgi:hypothetical protein